MAVKIGSLIIINNKELPYFSGVTMWSKYHKLNFIGFILRKIVILVSSYFLLKKVRDLRAKGYIFGCHWGWTLKTEQPQFPFLDFHMTDSHNEKFLQEKIVRMVSRDFITPHKPFDKFDIICVSNNTRRKKLKFTIEILIKLKRKIPDLTACLVISTPSKKFMKNTRVSEIDFLNLYNQQDEKFKRDIVLLRLSPELGQRGISNRFIQWLMLNSNTLFFSSEKEGVAKVVQEANLAKCDIVGSIELEGDTFSKVDEGSLFRYANSDECVAILEDRVIANRCNVEGEVQGIAQLDELFNIVRKETNKNCPSSVYTADLSRTLPGLESDPFFRVSEQAPYDAGKLKKIIRLYKKLCTL